MPKGEPNDAMRDRPREEPKDTQPPEEKYAAYFSSIRLRTTLHHDDGTTTTISTFDTGDHNIKRSDVHGREIEIGTYGSGPDHDKVVKEYSRENDGPPTREKDPKH